MKNSITTLMLGSALFACQNNTNSISQIEKHSSSQTYLSKGAAITDKDPLTVKNFLTHVEKNGGAQHIKVAAIINDCCQKKGCWMNVDLENGEEMMVRFKDYGFFVPKNAAEKTVIMEGKAYYDTLDIATLKHYAEDGGATKEELEKITAPKATLAFEAVGILLKEN